VATTAVALGAPKPTVMGGQRDFDDPQAAGVRGRAPAIPLPRRRRRTAPSRAGPQGENIRSSESRSRNRSTPTSARLCQMARPVRADVVGETSRLSPVRPSPARSAMPGCAPVAIMRARTDASMTSAASACTRHAPKTWRPAVAAMPIPNRAIRAVADTGPYAVMKRAVNAATGNLAVRHRGARAAAMPLAPQSV
jgi:hypothetical protein